MSILKTARCGSLFLQDFFHSSEKTNYMITFHITATTTSECLTIQRYARQQLKMSLTTWRKIKHTGSITLNGTAALPKDFIFPGDIVSFDCPETSKLEPAYGPLAIEYEDDSLLVVNKPAGLLVHPTSNQLEITLANYVIGHYREHCQSQGFHPVHRLDRNTSGLILIAKNPYIQQQLSGKFASSFTRSYRALVHGRLQNTGTINAPIGRKPGSIIERIVTFEGQQSLTEYQVIENFPTATLLSLSLLTGRTHQIRVHLAHIGHPLMGDDLYGGNRDLIVRHALHSAEITFTHPMSQTEIHLESALPDDMAEVINRLRTNKIF
jgi:23S rRNA pseudouridine1911/1915/1917 synthase